MAFITPRFRRDAWYTRLYRRAYGEDRGWIVWLRRLAGTTGFEPPAPRDPREEPKENDWTAERAAFVNGYNNRTREAYLRALAFLRAPPFEQPFFRNGPRVSICPKCWKIVFACLVYVPFVLGGRVLGALIAGVLRVFRSVFGALWRVFVTVVLEPIDTFSKMVGERFGNVIAGTIAVVAAWGLAGLFGLGIGRATLDAIWQSQPLSLPVSTAQLTHEHTRARERLPGLRAALVDRCATAIWANARRLAADYDGDWRLNEQLDYVSERIGRLGQGQFWVCGDPFQSAWYQDDAYRSFRAVLLGHTEYVGWLAHGVASDLWARYPDIAAAHARIRAEREAWRRERDESDRARYEAEIRTRIQFQRDNRLRLANLGWLEFERITTLLLPLRDSSEELYQKLREECPTQRDDGEGGLRWSWSGWSREEAAEDRGCMLAGAYFDSEVRVARTIIAEREAQEKAQRRAEQRRRNFASLVKDLKVFGKGIAIVLGAGLVISLAVALFLLCLLALDTSFRRYAAFRRAIAFTGRVIWLTFLALVSPVWIAPYLAVRAWRSATVVAWRRSVRQVLVDTVHLIAVMYHAVKERVCPFIEWEWEDGTWD
ncbi:MAG: hypothetical protein V1723_02745 [Candidatus Uhrbacteria bacterium]